MFKLVLREKINKTCIICSLAKISHRNKEWMNDKIQVTRHRLLWKLLIDKPVLGMMRRFFKQKDVFFTVNQWFLFLSIGDYCMTITAFWSLFSVCLYVFYWQVIKMHVSSTILWRVKTSHTFWWSYSVTSISIWHNNFISQLFLNKWSEEETVLYFCCC